MKILYDTKGVNSRQHKLIKILKYVKQKLTEQKKKTPLESSDRKSVQKQYKYRRWEISTILIK